MNKKLLLPIFLTVAVDVLGYTIVLPLLPFYAEKYGASPMVVGLLVTIYAVSQFVSSPILGRISDRVGRRPLLLVSQVGTLIGFLVLAFSSTLWMIFLSRLIDGMTAGNLSLAQAYISDVTEPKDRTKAFGIIGIAFGMGFLIGPGISGYLSQFGYLYPVFAAAGLSFTSILATYFFLPSNPPPEIAEVTEPKPKARSFQIINTTAFRRYFNDPKISGALFEYFLFTFTFSLYVSGFALFAERRFFFHDKPFGAREVGYVFTYGGFLGLIIQGGLLGKLVARFGESKLSWIGFLFSAVGYGFLGLSFGIPALLIANTFSGIGSGVLRPALSSLVSQKAPRTEQGAILGISQSLNSFSQILAPIVSGLFIEAAWLTPWAMMAAAFSFFGFYLVRRNSRPATAA